MLRLFQSLLLTLGFLCCLSTGRAQSISLNRKNASLAEIFVDIHKQAGYFFYYDAEAIGKASRVDIDVQNASLEQVLPICFRDQPLVYSVTDKIITVREKRDGKQAADTVRITGTVLEEGGTPMPGVSVTIKGKISGVATNESGRFELYGAVGDTLVVSHIGFQAKLLRVTGRSLGLIFLAASVSRLVDVSVELSTGYQTVPRERATGSFAHVSNQLFNRSVATNVLDHLDGVTSGLIFNKNINPNVNRSQLSVRGRSTIFSNPNPLIVVDNFPYDGDISSLNPNDVESITVLKDAAAASIWGSFSGNGVIVITTKKGKFNQPVAVTFNGNVTVQNKPDQWYQPRLSSSDFIDVSKFLYGQGYYDGAIGTAYGYLPPVPDLLNQAAAGSISQSDAQSRIDQLRGQDVRRDIDRYFYRRAVNQQYAISLTGGTKSDQYFFSAGLDRNLPSLTHNDYSRVTLTARNTYRLLHDRLEFSNAVIFTENRSTSNNSGYTSSYPYARLVDENGKALAINEFRQSFVDTVGGGRLLDWNRRPIDELSLADNTTSAVDYRINAGLKYTFLPGLDASVLYQFSHGESTINDYQSLATYSTRSQINSLTQLNFEDGSSVQPVPVGGILDLATTSYTSENLRGQLSFDHSWNGVHAVSAIAGAEMRDNQTQARSNRQYGYDPGVQSSVPVDYVDYFPNSVYAYSYSTIPSNLSNQKTISRYLSYFANAAYTFRSTYTISGSFRRDESNLFGVNANQKGVPLWSTGASWLISHERFYHAGFLPYLKLRASQGFNGNINSKVSAYTTANVYPYPNPYNAIYQTIVNPPNPNLRWERVHIVNLGLDLRLKGDRLDGSFEYYWKTGQDLIGQQPLAPQTGVPVFTGNTANMKGHGFDLQLHSRNLVWKNFSWETNLLVSRAVDAVSSFKAAAASAYIYLNSALISPLEGRPLYSVYAYPYAGLDAAGNPQGLVNGKTSEDYGGIENSTDPKTLSFMGASTPTWFGSLRNTVSFREFSLSFNISFKAGYVFRRPSLNDYELYYENGTGQADYAKRWQKPGDEKSTDVPALLYPADYSRANFYSGASVLVDKGDHVRLQDLQFSYDFNRPKYRWLPFASMKVYLYARNLGILWKANGHGIDPDVVPGYFSNVYPDPRSFSGGVTIHF